MRIAYPMTDPAGAGFSMLTFIGGFVDGIHGTPLIQQHR